MIATASRRVVAWPTALAGGLIGTILLSELRLRVRGWRAALLLSAYMLAFAGIVMVYLYNEGKPTSGAPSIIGVQLFQALSFLQLIIVLFVSAAAAAGSISGERQRKTWDLLLVTPQSSVAIIWNKFAGAVALPVLLLFASLPIFSLVFVFGEASVKDVARVCAVLLAAVVATSSASILISSVVRRVTTATLVAILIPVLFVGLALVTGYLEHWGGLIPSSSQGPGGPLSPMAEVTPFAGLASALPNAQHVSFLGGLSVVHHAFGLPITLHVWSTYVVFSVVLSILMLAVAVRMVRSGPSWLRDNP